MKKYRLIFGVTILLMLVMCCTSCLFDDHEHLYELNITEPTCTEQGVKKYVCSCGDYKIEEYILGLGNKETKIIKEGE